MWSFWSGLAYAIAATPIRNINKGMGVGALWRLYPVVEAANSDEDSSSSDSSGGFVRNSSSSSSVTSGNDSSGGDSSDNNSDVGAVSGGDSPQRATWVAQRDARRPSYPTRGRVQRDRRERENENKSSE